MHSFGERALQTVDVNKKT